MSGQPEPTTPEVTVRPSRYTVTCVPPDTAMEKITRRRSDIKEGTHA